jgi:aryl-alcohol dehydrogenase-like predicted oxidoreductase
MHKRRLGSANLEVSCIGLGAMPMSLAGRPSVEDSIATIHAALSGGIDLIDTADVYCIDDNDIGHNERLIARALRERGTTNALVATKGGLERPRGAWTRNASPAHLRAACERSLRALGVERIDLYQLHAPDPAVPFAESVGALSELRAQGKIRDIGLSNVDVDNIETARAIVPIVSVQNRLNPFDTESCQNGVLAHCEAHGIALLAYSAVGGHRGQRRVGDDRVLSRIATRHDASAFEVCLAFLLTLSPVLIPIPGASKPANARSSARAASLVLTREDLAELARAFPSALVASA